MSDYYAKRRRWRDNPLNRRSYKPGGTALADKIRAVALEHGLSKSVGTMVFNVLTNYSIDTEDEIKEIGWRSLSEAPNLGPKGQKLVGLLIGEEWPPRRHGYSAAQISTEELVAELRRRGYAVSKP